MSTSTTPTSPPPAPPRRPPGAPSPAPVSPAAAVIAIDPVRLLRQYWKWLAVAGVVGLVVGITIYFVLGRTMPRYDAVATFHVSPEVREGGDPGISGGSDLNEMNTFIESQVFTMRSDMILGRVVQEATVRQTGWAKPFVSASGVIDDVTALREIRRIVSSRRIPDTQIFVMRVRTPSRDDSKIIADAITDVYLDDLRTRSSRDLRNLRQQFDRQISQLRSEIQTIDTRMQNLLGTNQITSITEANSVAMTEVRSLQPAAVEILRDLSQTREQLANYQGSANNPGGPIFPEALRQEAEKSPSVVSMDQNLTFFKTEVRRLRTVAPNSRDVRRLENQISAMEQEREKHIAEKLAQMFPQVLENLRNAVRNLEAAELDLTEKLERAKKTLASTTLVLKEHDDLLSERIRKLEQIKTAEREVANLNTLIDRPTRVREFQRAMRPDERAFPKPIPIVGASLVLFPGLVGGLLFLREVREQRVRGPQDVALIPRTRVLGVVPDLSMDPSAPERIEWICDEHPGGVIAESIRQLRTSILKASLERSHRVILLVGGMPGSGSTSTVLNLAINIARTDTSVLVIDANLRRPSLHTHFDVADRPGLAEVLRAEATLDAAAIQTKVDKLSILPAGARDTRVFEKLFTPAMGQVLAQAKRDYEIVLIDAPPAIVASDAVALAGHADASVLVIRAMSEKRGLVARLRNQLSDCKAEFLGVVVNGVKASAGGYFKRNFQVTHEYGREAVSRSKPAADSNGTLASVNGQAGHIIEEPGRKTDA